MDACSDEGSGSGSESGSGLSSLENGSGFDFTGLRQLEEVDDTSFEEVSFPMATCVAVQQAWPQWLAAAGSLEEAGEGFFTQLFDSAPSLQSSFRSPKAIISMRFMTALGQIVALLGNASALKKEIEALAFKHLEIEVSSVKVAFFREAMLEVLDDALEEFSPAARVGFHALVNYMGGAIMFIRREYAGRIRTILSSWAAVNSKGEELEAEAEAEAQEEKEQTEPKDEMDEKLEPETDWTAMAEKDLPPSSRKQEPSVDGDRRQKMQIPTNFNEMLLFNASVMGFGDSLWMKIVLTKFDDMVKNVANFSRLQEECDVMSLLLAKYQGQIQLSEFKAVTLASLRSLLPQRWDSDHELAWTWLWENVENLLSAMLGKPAMQEAALWKFFSQLSAEEAEHLRKQLFPSFLELAPAGQEFLKQSATRINFIADKVVALVMELYRSPMKIVEEVSAAGLRHVGYGIPTEMFPPFVSSSVALVQSMCQSELTVEAFRWALALAAKIMVRTITEGSTLVMKAINVNNRTQLKKAMGVAPRGQRAREMLKITAGTQSISPFYWAIDSGALGCAHAILEDLLTIRADREVYYYGCESLFTYYPQLVQRLCATAPTLLPVLMDGLVWRSRQSREGLRRANYYVKHLLQADGDVAKNLAWLVRHGDPVLICHSTVVLFSDLLWNRLAIYRFATSKLYFLLTLAVFITGQAALFRHAGAQTEAENLVMFTCRCLNYLGCMSPLVYSQCHKAFVDIRKGALKSLPCGLIVPRYLLTFQEATSFCLMWLLAIMLTQEPFLWCINEGMGVSLTCQGAVDAADFYCLCAFLAMMLYWALLSDLAIFSMKISAYVLICSCVLSDVLLFFAALAAGIVAFGTSISALYLHSHAAGAHLWMESLAAMALRMYPRDKFQDLMQSSVASVFVCLFVFGVTIFMSNLLVAQLTQSFHDAHANMQGYARLKRAGITCLALDAVPKRKRVEFLQSLKLEEPLEFNEGDVGLPGGIQVLEPAGENVVTEESIKRFGGPTAPSAPWPREKEEEEVEDKLMRLEKKLGNMVKATNGKEAKSQGGSGDSAGGNSNGVGVSCIEEAE